MIRLIMLLVAVSACMASGARTAGEIFAQAPDRVLRLLPQSTRLDMLDYFRYGSDKASANALGGDARITSESPADIRLQLSERAEIQLCVLTAGRDTVVAVVETLMTPVPDSRIEFYSLPSWQTVKSPVKMPVRADWLTDEGRRHADELEALLPFDFVEARFDPDEGRLVLTNNARQYLTADVFEHIEPWIHPQLSYTVSGTKIKADK